MPHSVGNVTEFLLGGKDPGRCALRFVREEVSYGELRGSAERIATSLLQMGGRKGDRAVLIGDNSPFWVAAYLGIMRAGLVCVPLSTSVSAEDIEYVLRSTEAKIVFVQSSFTARKEGKFGKVHVVTDKEAPGVPEAVSQRNADALNDDDVHNCEDFPSVHPNDLAALMFTSGSTGRPRGVMVSHANIISNTESIIQYLRLTEMDRIMTVLPFHYCFGTSLLHTHLRVGASLVVDSRFMYPETVLQRMIDTESTGFAGVPSHFQILLNASSLRNKKFPRLRYVQQAGGHLAPTFVRQLRDVLPETEIFIMYGQTEATARLSYLPPTFLDAKLGSIGKGMPGVELRVLNESGREVRPGEVGEIVARGDNVTLGYWGDPNESESVFRAGALYTGDLARVDEDGFIYVVDRAKDFLKCGGERVSCRQLEEQLLAFDELLEAAVIGIPDGVLGESVKAFVVPRVPDCNGLAERLTRFCRGRISPPLVPKEIVVLKALPKNSAGKVLKTNLKTL
jgi:acyl-CoA synthetase (AMP-forming)/AMP-acid ligase II